LCNTIVYRYGMRVPLHKGCNALSCFCRCCLSICSTILYAGFDPLFWLHHCQLDRALWLYQSNNGGFQGEGECHIEGCTVLLSKSTTL
jgi:hypothetical protein